YRPYSISSSARSLSRRCWRLGSSSMTIATSRSASRNGGGIPESARAISRSNEVWLLGGRGAADLAPRRRFGMTPYRSRVPGPLPLDAHDGPPGFVVVVEPGDRIHFLDWGGRGQPGIVL